jgi:DNA polymerase III, epsilon subunit and related 3''-5'' exonucleases
MKVLLFDIETAPLLGYAFGLYEQNILHVVRDSFMLCFAYKELGRPGVICKSLRDYSLYKKDKFDDRELVKELHAALESADILIAHNGDAFDIKVANARFIKNGLGPVSEKISIDTLKEARKRFRFSSNKLDDLAQYAKIGKKKETGKALWIDCINGDIKAWKKMEEYNIHDVKLLEGVYTWLRPYMKSHPNLNVISGTATKCPACLSSDHVKDGYKYSNNGVYQKYRCKGCGKPFIGATNIIKQKPLVK